MARTQSGGGMTGAPSMSEAMATAPADAPTHHEFDRIPVILRFKESVAMAETYGFSITQGEVILQSQLMIPRGVKSKVLYIFMHPAATCEMLPMPIAMAQSGLHVLCAGSRYPKNDSALIMEKVAFDMGMHVREAREVWGYEKVILVGWSGGGSLSLFYQAQAESPTITHTPAGDLYDLTRARLPAADGVIFIAAHLSRAETLTGWMDPSVADELDPDRRLLELDIYDPQCPHQPHYDAEFVARFRQAQIERNRRISHWALETLERLRRGGVEMERGFVVHRTMCDVRWLDPQVEPNGRRANWCYLGDPRVVNNGPAGLARFSSLRSWLSQWSYDHSNVKGADNAARIHRTPVLQIENQADDAVPASHNPIIRAALATPDKEFVQIQGASHYYLGQPALMQKCLQHIQRWATRHAFVD